MQSTYETAITQVFKDEGGYTNDPHDPGGPTNDGITLEDARLYWKPDATADDVKNMPKSVAEEIYVKHYATPLQYNSLPAGVDYAVLDFGINSGIHRSAQFLQRIVGTPQDGVIGPITIHATSALNSGKVIDELYDARLSFLKSLPTWPHFGRGWLSRCTNGRVLAHQLTNLGSAKAIPPTTPIKTKSIIEVIYEFLIQFLVRR
jgi:lysozyme family protein